MAAWLLLHGWLLLLPACWSLRKDRISRNRRNLQNRNSAAAEIAIRFSPKILLKCSMRETGPKYPTIGLDYGYKSSFSLNHCVQSLRPAHRRMIPSN
jgi:hypothetical protein